MEFIIEELGEAMIYGVVATLFSVFFIGMLVIATMI